MTLTKSVLSIVPGLQATALVAENIKPLMKKNFMKGKSKISTKKIVKLGVKNLIGISLIKPTAQMINTL